MPFQITSPPALLSTDGVVGGEVTAQGTPDMTVAVAASTITINGHPHALDANASLAIATADATNPRFDFVVASSTALSVITGTPEGYPGPYQPVVPVDRVVLASVRVPAAATAITSAAISDLRTPPAIAFHTGLTLTAPSNVGGNPGVDALNVYGSGLFTQGVNIGAGASARAVIGSYPPSGIYINPLAPSSNTGFSITVADDGTLLWQSDTIFDTVFSCSQNGDIYMAIGGGLGNVGISTLTPEAKLHVAGGNARIDMELQLPDMTAPGTTATVGKLYVEAGALKFKSRNGTVTTLAPL